MPAIKTPNIAAIADFFLFIPNNDAKKHPVQAPVPGKGIPTNNNNPK